jgi:hypothetical protein
MTAPANRNSTKLQGPPDDEACLVAANVNPRTGFATDYLNHFNEAIMLLELMAEVPECRDDFFSWQPKKYDEHFATSKFKHRNVAIAAYSKADPALRQRLDTLATSMNEILMATREVMRQDGCSGSVIAIADLAVRWVKPLVARAGEVINGTEAEQQAARRDATPQLAVDALLAASA